MNNTRFKIAISFFVILCSFSFIIHGQSSKLLVTGKIVDSDTNIGLGYASISYNSGRYGTSTNEQGEFSLAIHRQFLQDTLKVSYLGYKTAQIIISNYIDGAVKTIVLEPTSFSTPHITIVDFNPYLMVRDALENLESRFHTKSHILNGFFRESIWHPGMDQLYYLGEGTLKTYKKGYKNSPKMAWKYDITTTDHTVIDTGYVEDAEATIEYLGLKSTLPEIVDGPFIPVSIDKLKNPEAFTCSKCLDAYDMSYKRYERTDQDEYYVIEFKGFPEKKTIFEGELYYNIENKVITRIEYRYTDRGIELYNKNYDLARLRSRDFLVEYKEMDGKYALSLITINNVFEDNQFGHKIQNSIEYATTSIQLKKVKKFKKKHRIHKNINFEEGLLEKGITKWDKVSSIPRNSRIEKIVRNKIQIKSPGVPALEEIALHDKIKFKTYKSALKKAKEDQKPVFIFVTATWCGPCQMVKSKTFKDNNVINFINKNFHPVFAETTRLRGQNIARKFDVGPIPTFLVVDKNERVTKREIGYLSASEFISIFKNIAEEREQQSQFVKLRQAYINEMIPDSSVTNADKIEITKIPEIKFERIEKLMSKIIQQGEIELLDTLFDNHDYIIENFGLRTYYEKALQTTYSTNTTYAVKSPKFIELFLTKYFPEDLESLIWMHLCDYYRYAVDDNAAAAQAGLKFLSTLEGKYISEFYSIINFVTEHLESEKDKEVLDTVLAQISSESIGVK